MERSHRESTKIVLVCTRANAEPVINKRVVSGESAYLVRWEANIERWLTEEDLRP